MFDSVERVGQSANPAKPGGCALRGSMVAGVILTEDKEMNQSEYFVKLLSLL